MTVQKTLAETTVTAIKNLATTDAVVEAILLMLSIRDRNMSSTNLYRFKRQMEAEGFKFSDKDFQKAWDQLANIGLGAIKRPRNNRFAEEFIWGYNLTDVPRVAFQEGKLLEFKQKAPPRGVEVVSLKRPPGRPKGSRNRPKVISKRGPGRPKGSGNRASLSKEELKTLRKLLSRLG